MAESFYNAIIFALKAAVSNGLFAGKTTRKKLIDFLIFS